MVASRPLCLGTAAGLVLAASALTYTNGVYPGKTGTMGVVPQDIVRTGMTCGGCHTPDTSVSAPNVSVSPQHYALAPGQTISMVTSETGGVPPSNPMFPWGGFCCEATRGTFVPGMTTQTDPTAAFVTHKFAFLGRSWSYSYVAPQTPGLVEFYCAANTVNENGMPDGDRWGFHGALPESISVPVRAFVNAPGVTLRGDGCPGSWGNVPVLGASQSPTVGNGSFGFDLVGAPPATAYTLLLGMNPTFQLDLSGAGVTGCTLYVQSLVSFGGSTSGGGMPQEGNGKAHFAMPIPNNPFLKGFTFQVQVVVLDPQNGRPIPVTLTNALSFTVQ